MVVEGVGVWVVVVRVAVGGGGGGGVQTLQSLLLLLHKVGVGSCAGGVGPSHAAGASLFPGGHGGRRRWRGGVPGWV